MGEMKFLMGGGGGEGENDYRVEKPNLNSKTRNLIYSSLFAKYLFHFSASEFQIFL